MNPTDKLIETLITAQKETNASVLEISKRMGELITIEAGRVVREEHQMTKNEKYDRFVDINENTLIRLRKFYGRVDKALDKIFVFGVSGAIIGILVLAGFNFLA